MPALSVSLALPTELLGATEKHAVYRCYSDDGQLLYVGTTGQLARRLGDHAQKFWFLQVRGITLEWYADEFAAMNAERRAIQIEHPRFNVQHRNSSVSPPRPRPSSRRKPVRRDGRPFEETLAIAAQIMAAEPGISGSELGRRLDRTPGYGRQLMRKLAAAAPDTGPIERIAP